MVQESRLFFPGEFARLSPSTLRIFCFCEVLLFVGKTKASLDAMNSELAIADIASVFGCITIAVSY